MAESRLIQTKLRPPRMTAPLVDRRRLNCRLDEHDGRVVFVAAPAGFGKTVLVVDWLASRAEPAAWLSLDRLDNEPGRFCSHLAAAVASLDVPGAARAAELIGSLAAPDLSLPPALFDALSEMGREPVIVLDDLHEIRSQEVMAVVERLVQVPGSCPRLVVLTREDPPFATGRLRVAGELLELRARDLRFTDDETTRLFDRLLPGVLDPALVRRLDQRTEGWIAGLRLAAIALHDAEDPVDLVESFAGTHRFVTDYLLEEALERQTLDVQQFLMETSILGRFNRESCAAVTGIQDAAARLAAVEAAGLFLVPLGGDGEWYRYHNLFAELLRFRLGGLQADRLAELHLLASEWFEADGDIAAALEHAAELHDQTRLLEVLDAHVLDMLVRGEMAALRHWTEQLREPFQRPYPMVLCMIGWLRVVTDRAPHLESILKAIRAALEDVPPGYDPARRRQAAVHIEVLSAYEARYARRLEEALRISDGVRDRVADDDPLTRGLLTYNAARIRMALADMAPAAELLEQAFGDHLRSGNLYLTLASLGRTAAVVAQTQGIRPATESLAAAFAFADERGLVANPAFSIVLYHRGQVEYLGGELDQAESSFRAAVELAHAEDFPEERGNGLVGLAQVAIARRSFDEAEALLVEAAALGQDSNMELFDTTLPLEQARLATAREVCGVGPPVPIIEPAEEGELWTTVRETEVTLTIGQALRAERWAAASALIERLESESLARGRGPALCSALLSRVLLPDCPDRWEVLDRTLRLAATRGYVRPLLDGGELFRDLLRAAQTRPLSQTARAHARLVLEWFEADGQEDPTRAVEPRAVAQLVEPLTEREKEVLACLFRGLSNKAIAQAIYVSVDTVKTHLKHIYVKLGAANRNEAVIRAGELGYGPVKA